ncbi:hypothetical protein [Sporosarcina gallistercoris]|nr:hypothetical protein [Sporosarcina gallistercoris]
MAEKVLVIENDFKLCKERVAGRNGRVARGNERVAGRNGRVARGNERVTGRNDRVARGNERVTGRNDRVARGNERVARRNDRVAAEIRIPTLSTSLNAQRSGAHQSVLVLD